jgi:hypothetical protein
MYYHRVMAFMYNRVFRWSGGYRHFDSRIDDFYRDFEQYRVCSINNRCLELGKLQDFRITRFVRDPRDMVVSGYFYHKKGAEGWCNIVGASNVNWEAMNGVSPEQMGEEKSFSQLLQSLDDEAGLIAEIDFRKRHFDSMKNWPVDHPNIKMYRYEDILGNEERVFAEMMSFYGLSWPERKLGVLLARRFSARGKAKLKSHIRNPKAGQWKELFTPKVARHFEQNHGELLEHYGYN